MIKNTCKLIAFVLTFSVVSTTNASPISNESFESSIETKQKVRPRNDEEVRCLALNIYHEARGSILADRIAVSDVVFNRVRDSRYPNSVCGVVMQGEHSRWFFETYGRLVPIKNRCQFSWYCDGKPDEPTEEAAWKSAMHLAYTMYYYNEYLGITEGATHYHATYVNPYWAPTLQLVGQIGDHIFYRWVR